jgi:hypothetical protein
MLDGNLSLFEKLVASRVGKAATSRVEGVITTAGRQK